MYFFVFLLYPVAEILVFILITKSIGWASTLLLALATSFLGATLLRGHSTRGGFSPNERASAQVENYLFVNLGCFLLILPGFITDLLGLTIMTSVGRKALLRTARFLHFRLGAGARGPFSVFRAYRFGDGFAAPSGLNPNFHSASTDGTNDAPIDVDSVSPPSDAAANVAPRPSDPNDDEPIDVEFIVRNNP